MVDPRLRKKEKWDLLMLAALLLAGAVLSLAAGSALEYHATKTVVEPFSVATLVVPAISPRATRGVRLVELESSMGD